MPTNAPLPDYTPEEKARILAEMLKKFPVEGHLGDIEDAETFPADQVTAELEQMVARSRNPK